MLITCTVLNYNIKANNKSVINIIPVNNRNNFTICVTFLFGKIIDGYAFSQLVKQYNYIWSYLAIEEIYWMSQQWIRLSRKAASIFRAEFSSELAKICKITGAGG